MNISSINFSLIPKNQILFILVNTLVISILTLPFILKNVEQILILPLIIIAVITSTIKYGALDAQGKRLFFACIIFFVTAIPQALLSWNPEALDGPSRFVLALPIFLLLHKVKLSKKLLLITPSIALIITMPFAVVESLDYARVALQLGIIPSGYVAAFFVSIALYLSFRETLWKYKIIHITAFICGMFIIISTGTKGAYIAILGSSFITFFLIIQKLDLKRSLLLVGFIVLCLSALLNSDRVSLLGKDISGISQENYASSAGIRLVHWYAAFDGIAQSPFIGMTYEEQRVIRAKYGATYKVDLTGNRSTKVSSHNEIIYTLFDKGIMGLLALLALYIIPFSYFIKRKSTDHADNKTLKDIGILVIISALLCGLTELVLVETSTGTIYITIIFVIYTLLRQQENSSDSKSEDGTSLSD